MSTLNGLVKKEFISTHWVIATVACDQRANKSSGVPQISREYSIRPLFTFSDNIFRDSSHLDQIKVAWPAWVQSRPHTQHQLLTPLNWPKSLQSYKYEYKKDVARKNWSIWTKNLFSRLFLRLLLIKTERKIFVKLNSWTAEFLHPFANWLKQVWKKIAKIKKSVNVNIPTVLTLKV